MSKLSERYDKFVKVLLDEHFDPDDFYYYNEPILGTFWEKKREARDNFIDGATWCGWLMGSCILNPTPTNLKIAEKCLNFIEMLFKMGCETQDRWTRTYRKFGDSDGKWKLSPTMEGYYYRDSQAQEGPLSLMFLTRTVLASQTEIPVEWKERVYSLYMRYINRFVENDEYMNLNPDGSKGDYWDLRPWGLSGIFTAPFCYTAVAVGAEVSARLGNKEREKFFIDQANKIWSESYIQKIDTIFWILQTITCSFNCFVHRWRGKFSNESCMNQLLSSWMVGLDVSGLMIGERRKKFTKACNIIHNCTKDWQIPLYDAIWARFCQEEVDKNEVSHWLEVFSEERRKYVNCDDPDAGYIVPLEERKPSAWSWRQNPYSTYVATEPVKLSNASYAPADWITAYNMCRYAGILSE